MRRNLAPPPDGDVVERPLALEPRERALHGLALLVDGLPLRRAIEAVAPRAAALVLRIQVDHGGGRVLPDDDVVEGSRRIPGIGQYIPRMELGVGEPGLREEVRGSQHVVDVACDARDFEARTV